MSYPPPPGINSLPPRPPPSTNSKPGFKSAFNQSSTTTYSSPSTHHGQPPSAYQSYSAPPSGVSSYPTSYSSQPQQHYGAPPSYSQQSQSYAQPAQSYSQQPQSYGAAPQIRNPFPMPGTAAVSTGPVAGPAASSDYDPEMAAQIAQWQSAYAPRDPNASAPTTTTGVNPTVDPSRAAEVANLHPDKQLTVKREGGGKKWTDDSLLEWDPSHLRLFVGNLAGEVTDDSLLKAFSRWSSVQKARVIRDKRTTKSKGYGFVSFSDADDFFQAAKDMNNKYIQSRPVTVRKANTEIKVSNAKQKYNNKKGNKSRQYRDERSQEPHLGPKQSAGVVKPGQKTKNGLKLLG